MAKCPPPPRRRETAIPHEELRGQEFCGGPGWGMGGSAEPHPFCLNGGQDFSQTGPLLPAPTNPVGRGLAFFFLFLTVSYELQIRKYSPVLSPNNQLVPESESPAQLSLSLKTQGRLSPSKAVRLLISGAGLGKQSNTFAGLWARSFAV